MEPAGSSRDYIVGAGRDFFEDRPVTCFGGGVTLGNISRESFKYSEFDKLY